MVRLTDYTAYRDAQAHFSSQALWDLFDGSRDRLNIAHECIDRHANADRPALSIAHADGTSEIIGFAELSAASARFAHYLQSRAIVPGDRVAIMLEPSLAYYTAMFGAMKAGAVAVPMFTLFGADGIRLRAEDCRPKLLVTNTEKAD